MYHSIIAELNNFLTTINVPAPPINPDAFQGVFVKKLSNQNIIKEKRRINAGDTVSTVNQTHIDITGRSSMLFFFEELNDETTPVQSIDIDLYDNNLRYLRAINTAIRQTDTNGNSYFVRSSAAVPAHLTFWGLTLHSSAYKKYGHAGEQVQINIPDSEELFTQLHRCAFQDDALVLLKYDYQHYMALLIPYELCGGLYAITNTHGNQNVNVVVINPAHDPVRAHELQYDAFVQNMNYEEITVEILQDMLNRNQVAGTDIEKTVKMRVSQGSFRKLLLLGRHQCHLCDISTTSALRASHIKEWSKSSREERIDSDNGLLLCANHDALFDRHLISFEPDSGDICISSSINDEQREALNLPASFNLSMTDRMKAYMRAHYKKFMDKENL